MEFLAIKVSGFKSYGPEVVEVPLNGDGVNQIAGINGTGKTNLVDAFLWVLTGKTIKELKVDQVVNWHLPKGQGTEVSLAFRADDGHLYEARRYRRHPDYKNSLILLREGEQLEDEDTKADPQAKLQKITGLGYDELVGSLVFSAEDFKNFIGKKADEKRRFAETFFRIDRFRKPAEIARDKRLETKRQIEAHRSSVNSAQVRVENESERLEQAKTDAASWASERRSKLEGFQEEQKGLIETDPETGLFQYEQVDRAYQVVQTAQGEVNRCQQNLLEAQESLKGAAAALSEDEVNEELQKHEAREKVQAQIDAVNRDLQSAEANVMTMQAQANSAAQKEEEAQGQLRQAQQWHLEASNSEQSVAIPRAQRAKAALAEAKQKVADAQQPDCPYCGQTLPEAMVTAEEIERRLNSAKQVLQAASEEASNAVQYLREVIDSKNRAAAAIPEAEKLIAQRAEERHYAAEALADAHSTVADFKTALYGDEESDPPIVGLYQRLEMLPAPKMPRERLAEQRSLAAWRVDAERLVTKRTDELRRAQGVLQAAQGELDRLPTPKQTRESLAQARDRLIALAQLIEATKAEVNPHEGTVSSSTERLAELQTELDDFQKKLDESEELHPYLDALVRAFERDLPQAVLRQLLPRFNANLQGYLDNLLPGCALSFNEALEDYLIYEEQEVEANQLSTGQRARINFAICMATFSTMLWERGRVTNVAFFDEVLDMGLDEKSQIEAFNLIKGFPMTVFIITHHATLREEFDEIYEVQRKFGGYSQLVPILN